MERVSHKGELCGAWSSLQMSNHRLLRISSYVLWFKVGVDELAVLVWATPEFTQLSFLHVVKCDWVFLWAAQDREHHSVRGHRVTVFVVDNVEDGKTMVDMMVMGLE